MQSIDLHQYTRDLKGLSSPVGLFETLRCIQQGFEAGLVPKLTDDGTSGTYILRGGDRDPIAVFKPIDEEQRAPNNPRGYVGNFNEATFRQGVLSGEATIREVAAYLLDYETGNFSDVPTTSLANLVHPIFGT